MGEVESAEETIDEDADARRHGLIEIDGSPCCAVAKAGAIPKRRSDHILFIVVASQGISPDALAKDAWSCQLSEEGRETNHKRHKAGQEWAPYYL